MKKYITTKELDQFYTDNNSEIDEMYHDFCFNQARFESSWDAQKHFNNDEAFWEFVGDYYNKKQFVPKVELKVLH